MKKILIFTITLAVASVLSVFAPPLTFTSTEPKPPSLKISDAPRASLPAVATDDQAGIHPHEALEDDIVPHRAAAARSSGYCIAPENSPEHRELYSPESPTQVFADDASGADFKFAVTNSSPEGYFSANPSHMVGGGGGRHSTPTNDPGDGLSPVLPHDNVVNGTNNETPIDTVGNVAVLYISPIAKENTTGFQDSPPSGGDPDVPPSIATPDFPGTTVDHAVPVPDDGATTVFLGLSFAAFCILRRRAQKAP